MSNHKKYRQQHENSITKCEESTESGDGSNEEPQCPHLFKSINLKILNKLAKNTFNNSCTDCQVDETAITEELDSDDEVAIEPPKQWICLQCGYIACGKDKKCHAIKHYETPRSGSHYIVMDTQQWSAWCYKCEIPVVSDTKNNSKYERKLIEIRDILKRGMKINITSQSEIPLCQNQTIIENVKKISMDLPKVGGLTNLGNTCFFNAVLQCLAQTPYLIKVLDDLQVPGQTFILPGGKLKGSDDEEVQLTPIEGTLDTNISFTPVLRKTLVEMQNSNGQVYRPAELLNSLRKKTMQCTDGGQHDSHELLRHLLELVRNEDVKRYQSVILKKTGLDEKMRRKSVDNNVISRLKFYGNQANAKFLGPERVFRGELVSTLQCLECQHTSPRTEPFLDLSLPILIDKTLPPTSKRKSISFDNSIESTSNNVSNMPKHESKKEHRGIRRYKRQNKESNYSFSQNASHISEEKKDESDADVEDNIENEEVAAPQVGESGYSSEKPSELTSPISLAELHSTDKSSYDFIENANSSTSPIIVAKTDSIENKNNGKPNELLNFPLPTSLVQSIETHSDFTSPEGPTISPLSSPLTSKDSPTSPISSAIDDDDIDKVEKVLLQFDTTEKLDLGDKEDSVNETNDKNFTAETENCTMKKKLTNGFSDITSNMSKLYLSSPPESPKRYPIKEGECSIQLCLNQFTVLELLTGNNKVGCAACTERMHKGKKKAVKMVCTDSTKQYLISCVPAVLILHLKRFQVQKFNSSKVGKHISFPMILDLSPICKDYTKPRIYALYGIVEHSGNLYGGHYAAYVKSRAPLKPDDPRWAFLPSKDGFENKKDLSESNFELESDEADVTKTSKIEPPPGRWYYVSDSRVLEVDEKTVLNSQAYLLFYERIL